MLMPDNNLQYCCWANFLRINFEDRKIKSVSSSAPIRTVLLEGRKNRSSHHDTEFPLSSTQNKLVCGYGIRCQKIHTMKLKTKSCISYSKAHIRETFSAFISVHLKRGLKTTDLFWKEQLWAGGSTMSQLHRKLIRNNQPAVLSLLAQHT